MAERTAYAPGTFCWTDLTCTEQEAAKAFYTGLFGWEAVDLPAPGGGFYSMMRLDGQAVATIVPQPPPMREQGVPPAWNSYVSVDSADAVAERAAELGASVVAPPFDVPGGSGRMAAFIDPQGAYFLVWQPMDHFGAQVVNQHGALTWNDLNTPDIEGSRSFYAELFGWSFEAFEGMPDYLVIRNGEQGNGGVRALDAGGAPGWLVYFGTDDAGASLAKVAELGGDALAGPTDIGVGQIAVARDSIGATFALYGGEFSG